MFGRFLQAGRESGKFLLCSFLRFSFLSIVTCTWQMGVFTVGDGRVRMVLSFQNVFLFLS